ncbi:hypothetical protein EVAR_92850_1 [Eumeta japonica]|uniref:Uncharacterized protein n=1 Tax=Eumeta variegata TaxID=151549 RepID=A0A4C1T9X3_EUMVA|nr:hypothetical protein EVAR_92850_1 [Eumeta japonica]
MKDDARRLFITGLQNSSAVVSISVTNFVMVAHLPSGTTKTPYDRNRQACDLPLDSGIFSHRHESNTINPTQKLCRRWTLNNLTEEVKKHGFIDTTSKESSNRPYVSIEMRRNQPKWRLSEMPLSG